jgi:hypothetical protein
MTMRRVSQDIARATALAILLCGGGCSSERKTESSQSGASQETFVSAEAAIDTFIAAARQGDRDRLKGMFGPELNRLSSGDERIDDVDLQLLAAAYDRKHGLADQTADAVTLTVGESDWKFPAPIVKRGTTWQFDTAAGVEEVIDRRIGNNEFDAMRSCLAYVAAQEQYAKTDPDGDHVKDYAPKLMSTPGTRDGLIWPDEMGEPRSFFGPALATARAEGKDHPEESPRGYRGYRFRALDAQGPGASGGAKSYVDSQGHMTGGFALIAWPAIYNETGVMTFLVGREGVIFERNLGPGTAAAADSIQTFDPGTDWVAIVQ